MWDPSEVVVASANMTGKGIVDNEVVQTVHVRLKDVRGETAHGEKAGDEDAAELIKALLHICSTTNGWGIGAAAVLQKDTRKVSGIVGTAAWDA